MKGIENIKKRALEIGACTKVKSLESIKSAVELLLTPQGREFAMKTGFPSLDTWRANKDHIADLPEVFLDIEKGEAVNQDCVCIGDSDVSVELNNTARLYHIIAMHGASVEINASDYAVVTVNEIGSKIKIKNDGTAIVTVEQKEKEVRNG